MILPNLKLAFYGDDFTGSTDALESLSRAGARTVLFLDPPTPSQLAAFPKVDAIGIAGMTRALPPEAMAAALHPALVALKDFRPPIVHYKVCSTFDSSPEMGSIGRAIEVGMEVFETPFVPVVVGAPSLGRHCVFGNLFARYGIGSQGAIHRLDRHPAMARHPVTPADEADLLRHLAKQTDLSMALLDILTLREGEDVARASLSAILDSQPDIVLIDLLDEEQLETIGTLLDRHASPHKTLFAVGSSGVGAALGAHWGATGQWIARKEWPAMSEASPLLILSGSASPVTAEQIRTAVHAGFKEIALDTTALLQGFTPDPGPINDILASGHSVIVHTCCGPDDPRLQADTATVDTAQVLGETLGRLAREAAAAGCTKRIGFAGGDSSSHAARALGLVAVAMITPHVPGAPLCRAYSADAAVDGLEVNFKGGQVGDADYMVSLAKGPSTPFNPSTSS